MIVNEALIALFSSAFVSSTLFPGGSEAAYLAFLYYYPDKIYSATLVAGCGNALGAITGLILGRLFPTPAQEPAIKRVKRWGAPILFFSWLPVIGDALPVAAGWLRIAWFPAVFWITFGKFSRYLLLAYGYSFFFSSH